MKIYSGIDGINPPVPDYNNYNHEVLQAQENKYIEQLRETCKKADPDNELVGEIIRFARGDGYALYMVNSTKPLSLISLEMNKSTSVN